MPAGSGDEEQAREPSPPSAARPDDSSAHEHNRAPRKSPQHVAAESDFASHRRESATADPPLPYDEAPPLPDEPPPSDDDDGWDAKWDYAANTWYFLNSKTGQSQWDNPRMPAATVSSHSSYDRFAKHDHLLVSFPA